MEHTTYFKDRSVLFLFWGIYIQNCEGEKHSLLLSIEKNCEKGLIVNKDKIGKATPAQEESLEKNLTRSEMYDENKLRQTTTSLGMNEKTDRLHLVPNHYFSLLT